MFMDFEKKIARLEQIVKMMEAGEISLEDSLKLFEEGVKLSRDCNVQLSEAEQKVKVLMGVDANGQAITQDFTPQK